MWHFRQSNNVIVILVLVLSAGFVLQVKMLYNHHQKYLRVEDIKDRMSTIGDGIKSIHVVANTTSILLERLEKTVRSQHKARMRLR